MNGPNEWMHGLVEAADANGWVVVGYQATEPGSYIRLQDMAGTTVTIEGNHGLLFPYYVGEFKARPHTGDSTKPQVVA